jgi:hypothetical protein
MIHSRTRVARTLPYVLAVYGEWTASVTPEEFQYVLLVQHGGWFKSAVEVSGVIYCKAKDLRPFHFEFFYYPNPYAARPSALLST